MVSHWRTVYLLIHPLVCISFPDDNSSKHQWIFTKLGMCIEIVKICFEIANGQTLLELSVRDTPVFSFLNSNKYM